MLRTIVARIDWRRDAVRWGRLLAVTFAVLGTLFAAMEARAPGDFSDSTRTRVFISGLLGAVWGATLILIVTELAARLEGAASRPIASVAYIVRALGVAIMLAGCAVSIWSAVELGDEEGSFTGNAVRYAIGSTIHPYLWEGGLLLILAAVADYVGWRSDEELPDEEEASAVLTEP